MKKLFILVVVMFIFISCDLIGNNGNTGNLVQTKDSVVTTIINTPLNVSNSFNDSLGIIIDKTYQGKIQKIENTKEYDCKYKVTAIVTRGDSTTKTYIIFTDTQYLEGGLIDIVEDGK